MDGVALVPSRSFPSSPIACCLGTRPEALKLAPVIRALATRGLPVLVLASGQHPSVATELLPGLGIRVDEDLALFDPRAPLAARLAAILAGFADRLERLRPALVIVQGDTTTALAGALAGFHAGVPVAHVEAGLRTGDLSAPFPEEGNRAMIARLAVLHFAPTAHAAARLRREAVAGHIEVTGNSAIDALLAVRAGLENSAQAAALAQRFPFALGGPPLVLATYHRRENARRLGEIGEALARIAGFGLATLAVPLHPNPMSEVLRQRLRGLTHVHLLPPLSHEALVWLMTRARLVVTDSGGLQEEAPALGVRTLVVRRSTERPEAAAAGVAHLVPPRTRALVAAIRAALAAPAPAPAFPFGDGHASVRIGEAIEAFLAPEKVSPRLRPALP